MSSLARLLRSPLGYGLAALLFAFELGVVWLMLHPQVPDTYRAYYIDRTTTCLDQPVSGTYRFQTLVPFLPGAAETGKPLRVCGWEGPAGDGLHAVGTSARLRFSGTAPDGTTRLRADLSAVTRRGEVQPQTVIVVIDGVEAARWDVTSADPSTFTAMLPAGSLADGRLEVEFRLPQAVKMGPTDPDTRWRSVRLLAVGVLAG